MSILKYIVIILILIGLVILSVSIGMEALKVASRNATNTSQSTSYQKNSLKVE